VEVFSKKENQIDWSKKPKKNLQKINRKPPFWGGFLKGLIS
jgi:hypothetical protein